jgi:hypothetical protein
MFIEDFGLSFKMVGTRPRLNKALFKLAAFNDIDNLIKHFSDRKEVFMFLHWHGERKAGLFNMLIGDKEATFEISKRTWNELPLALRIDLTDSFDEILYIKAGDKYNLRKVICL